jgi:hypothetical protein
MTTVSHNTSPAGVALGTAHSRSACPGRLNESFWLPSNCPNGLATATRPLDALTDAEEVTWDGGRYATASYECQCCGTRWTQNWPAALALGPNWRRRHEPPVHWVAGVDSPRYTAGQIESEKAAAVA